MKSETLGSVAYHFVPFTPMSTLTVVPDMILSMSHIDLIKNDSYLIGILEII